MCERDYTHLLEGSVRSRSSDYCLIETWREIASDLIETYMSSVSNRMNEIMKVLTLMAPSSFIDF